MPKLSIKCVYCRTKVIQGSGHYNKVHLDYHNWLWKMCGKRVEKPCNLGYYDHNNFEVWCKTHKTWHSVEQ